MKSFVRTKEDFICENCGTKVHGNGYTNHCPNCLYSKHVDFNPGDRANICRGLMMPIGYDSKKGILHKCTICKQSKYNKVNPTDNTDAVIALSTKSS